MALVVARPPPEPQDRGRSLLSSIDSYQWLQYWYSSGYPAWRLCLAWQGWCYNWFVLCARTTLSPWGFLFFLCGLGEGGGGAFWLKNWYSDGCHGRRLAFRDQCLDWLARCTVAWWRRKFDLQLLSESSSTYNCLSRSAPDIYTCRTWSNQRSTSAAVVQ